MTEMRAESTGTHFSHFSVSRNLTDSYPSSNFAPRNQQTTKTMKAFVTFLCFLLLMAVPFPINAKDTQKQKTVTIKKYPKNRYDNGTRGIRAPSAYILCTVDEVSGIKPLDTSDVESYEVWDINDTAPVAIFGDEAIFIDYILEDHPDCIIKLFSSEYVYVGFIEATQTI